MKFAQLKPPAVRGITWDVFLANAKDVVKLYANGITVNPRLSRGGYVPKITRDR